MTGPMPKNRCPRLSHAHERGDEAAITNPKPLKPIDGIALLFAVRYQCSPLVYLFFTIIKKAFIGMYMLYYISIQSEKGLKSKKLVR